MSELRDRPESWPVLGSRDLHRDDWVVALREDTLAQPGDPDETFSRLVVEHPGAAMALAVDDQERVCCIRQYRHVVKRSFVELPAGICDAAGEPPLETAKRELREEVELQADDWRLLLTVWPTVGLSTEVHHLFLARGLSPAPRGSFAMRHEEAEMERFWTPMADLRDAILDGRVQQGPMALSVLAYDALKRRGEL